MVSILHVVAQDYHQAHYPLYIRAHQQSGSLVHENPYRPSDTVDFFSSPGPWREGLCVPEHTTLLSSSKPQSIIMQFHDADATYLLIPLVQTD